jgi:hypothetical protein
MNKRSPNEFRRDIEMRQRNLVYPDTLRNETRGWRFLITSKEPLSVLQVVGLLLLYSSVLSLLFLMGYAAFRQFHSTSGNGLNRILTGFGPYVVIVVLCGAAFLFLRWRVQKAIVGANKRPPLRK